MDQECLYANKKNTKIFGRGVCGTCCAVHFTIENTNADAPALIFYMVHQFAEVQLNDETIYSLTSRNHGIGLSPSSNWTVILFYPSDNGQQITVTITPVYKSAINHEVEFAIGSEYSFLPSVLKLTCRRSCFRDCVFSWDCC